MQELSARLAELVAAGDLQAARAVSDTITRLLGADGDAAAVVDLRAERMRKRKP